MAKSLTLMLAGLAVVAALSAAPAATAARPEGLAGQGSLKVASLRLPLRVPPDFSFSVI